MRDQVNEVINFFTGDTSCSGITPASRHLLNVNLESPKLDPARRENFHSTTAKLLYLEKRARPDLELAVSFLTTRVSDPTEQDWNKLCRVMSFLENTKDEVRVIGCDTLESIYTWIDAAYAVHDNMRSHTGGLMSMGWGALEAKSTKQKLNTKSSTESELVGMSDYLPYNIWWLNFLTAQGYTIINNTIFQDNQSAIKMETNGRNSCTGNSRHISIRYFFVKDRVDKGEVKISYCPTELMLADYYTKPLQGSLFKKFWKVIMGHEHISTLIPKYKQCGNKERVETGVKSVFPNCEQSNKMKINKKVTFNVPEYTYADAVRKGGVDIKDTNDENKMNIQIEQTKINKQTYT